MNRYEDKLEKYLGMLDVGLSLDEVLNEIPAGDQNLRQSLILVTSLRSLPEPPVDPISARKQDIIIQQLIQSKANSRTRNPPFSLANWWYQIQKTFARAGILLFLLVIVTFTIFALQSLREPEERITVAYAIGQTEVRLDPSSNRWSTVKPGDIITAGQQLRTGSGSSLTLDFQDGSRLVISSNTQLTVTTLTRTEGDRLAVELTQHSGNTHHAVSKNRDPNSAYIVHTPTSEAMVLGTSFSVSVADDGRAFYTVQEGIVQVRSGIDTVALQAGFATFTQTGQRPATPQFSFSNHGELQHISDSFLIVDELEIFISNQTIVDREIRVGDFVMVTGRILAGDRWVAETIEKVESPDHLVTFTGLLQAITSELWLVDGVSVFVTSDTERLPDLIPGDLVRITYTNLSSGRRLALQIERLVQGMLGLSIPTSQSPMVNTPVSTPSPRIHPRPGLTFIPDDLHIAGCQAQLNLTFHIHNDGTPPNDVAENVLLGFFVLSGGRFVDLVDIYPSSLEIIRAGETAAVDVQVNLTSGWLSARPGTEVKLQVFVVSETNRPDHHPTRLTITLVQSCTLPTQTPASTSTLPIPTQQDDPPIPTATNPAIPPTPVPGGDCPGPVPVTEGQNLAALYGVSYAEIMGWFCDGFGFGEIDLAYSLSQTSGVAVADIFAMRLAGMDWGEIMQQLGLIPDPGDGDDDEDEEEEDEPEETEDPEDEGDGPPAWVTPEG
jgi:hypothetical protein